MLCARWDYLQSWICQFSNFYFIYTVIQICYSDSDNNLIPDQGQAEAGERLQGIKFWECMKPWLGYNSCGKSLDLSCTFILSVTCCNPNRIIWSKGSLGVLSFQNQQQNKKEMHTWGTVTWLNCISYTHVSGGIAIYTSWESALVYFIYSYSPLKNIPSSPTNFLQTFEVTPTYFWARFSLNQNRNDTISLHGKRSILPNLQRFRWTKWCLINKFNSRISAVAGYFTGGYHLY